MCATGSCPWEVTDYNNGGTICRKPGYMLCQFEQEECDEEDDNEVEVND